MGFWDKSTKFSLRGFGGSPLPFWGSLRSKSTDFTKSVCGLFDTSLRTFPVQVYGLSMQVYGLCKSPSADFLVQVYELFQSPQT